MAMITNLMQPSASNVSRATYSLSSTELGNNQPRDVSFSSYLSPGEETFVHKIVQSGQPRSFTADPEAGHLYCLGRKEEEGEIGVFEAEKYFNGEIDDEDNSPKSVTPSKKLVDFEHKNKEGEGERHRDIVTEPVRPRLHAGTPSIRSESSLNSQRALLRNTASNPAQKESKVSSSRSLLAALGCKCSCSDKDSIDVIDDENSAKLGTSLNARSNSNGIFAAHTNAPISDPWTGEKMQGYKVGKFGSFGPKICLDLPSLRLEDKGVESRKSLEVFGSPLLRKKGNEKETFDIERRLTMLSTWDANPRKEAESEVVDDTESDASSDLFEIESLTGKVKSYLTRQTAKSDCATPTVAHYAPSEASIEWSVVTASAGDLSVLSDPEEVVRGPLAATKGLAQAKNGINHGLKRRPMPGILLGCKSQKAVRVAGEAHRASSGKLRSDPRVGSGWRSNLPTNPVARFQAEARLTGFDPKYRKNASHLVYIGN